MLLSSGVVWRHRELRGLPRASAPAATRSCSGSSGSGSTTRSLGSSRAARRSSWQETGNPLTVGKRFDPRGSSDALVAAAGGRAGRRHGCAGTTADDPRDRRLRGVARARRRATSRLRRRCDCARTRGATGDGLGFALDARCGRSRPGWTSSTAATCRTRRGTRARASSRSSQLYGRFARIFDEDGVEFFRGDEVSWSETNVVAGDRAAPRRAGVLPARRRRRSNSASASARSPRWSRRARRGAGGGPELPFEPPPGTVAAVRVVAVDHAHDRRAAGRRARARRRRVDGLWAAGVDAGGIATGGYASGLAQALVLGLAAGARTTPAPRRCYRVRDARRRRPRVAREGRHRRPSLTTSVLPPSSNSCADCGGSPSISRSCSPPATRRRGDSWRRRPSASSLAPGRRTAAASRGRACPRRPRLDVDPSPCSCSTRSSIASNDRRRRSGSASSRDARLDAAVVGGSARPSIAASAARAGSPGSSSSRMIV